RELLPPPRTAAELGAAALGRAAARLAARRAALFCAGERAADPADRLDRASRSLPQPLGHAGVGGPGGAARLLADPPGGGRQGGPASAGRSSPHPVARLVAGRPPRLADRRPRLPRPGPDAVLEAAAVPVHPAGDRRHHGATRRGVGAAAGRRSGTG